MTDILESLILKESRKVLENMMRVLDERSIADVHQNFGTYPSPCQIYPTGNLQSPCTNEVQNGTSSNKENIRFENPLPGICNPFVGAEMCLVSNNGTSSNNYARDLFSWCPVNIKANGACCIAGLCRSLQSDKQCDFIITDELETVSYSGKSVKTATGMRFRLQGSISWSTYCLMNPGVANEKLTPELESAFQHGFPKANWRDSIRDMYLFSIQPNTGNAESTYTKEQLRSPKLNLNPRIEDNSTEQSNPYQGILESYQGCANLHSLVDSAVRKAKHFLQVTDVPVTDEVPLNTTPIISGQLPSSSLSAKPIPVVDLTHLPLDAGTKQHINSDKSSSSSSLFRSRNMDPALERAKRKVKLSSKPKVKRKKLVQKKISRVKSRDKGLFTKLAQKYQLRTESGQNVDVRSLKRTRSGRWVLPKLDVNFRQAVVIDRDRIVGVAMHDDL